MKTLSLSVRCTREEYIAFCASRHKTSVWTTVIGIVLLAAAGVGIVMSRAMGQWELLLVFAGVLMLLMSPMILPMIRRGEAGRRYDASDALRDAVSVVITDDTLTVHTACQEGCVPLSLLTQVQQSKDMLALVFGRELTVCLPKRAMTDDEWQALTTLLQ